MNGPLLVTLLPPEPPGGAAVPATDPVPYVIAAVLLAGLLLSLWVRPPGR